jgi:hypothetical protein
MHFLGELAAAYDVDTKGTQKASARAILGSFMIPLLIMFVIQRFAGWTQERVN